MLDRPPAVAIDGNSEFADGSQQPLGEPKDWLATDVYDRRGTFWFETQFDDGHWSKPQVGEPVAWRGQVDVLPRAITVPRRSYWILPSESENGAAALPARLSFTIRHARAGSAC
jgi:hypothetical protein